jgi:hypothetical protein
MEMGRLAGDDRSANGALAAGAVAYQCTLRLFDRRIHSADRKKITIALPPAEYGAASLGNRDRQSIKN